MLLSWSFWKCELRDNCGSFPSVCKKNCLCSHIYIKLNQPWWKNQSYVVVYQHFEVDQSFSLLNFNLCYLSGLLAVKDCYSPPPPPPPLRKAASFLLTLGSKSGFVCGFCSEALTQHDMTTEQAVPPSNQFLLFQSNITRWPSWLWFWTRFSVGNHHQLLHKHWSVSKSRLYTQTANDSHSKTHSVIQCEVQ